MPCRSQSFNKLSVFSGLQMKFCSVSYFYDSQNDDIGFMEEYIVTFGYTNREVLFQ